MEIQCKIDMTNYIKTIKIHRNLFNHEYGVLFEIKF